MATFLCLCSIKQAKHFITFNNEKNEKDTYITLIGLDESKAKVEELSNKAIDGIKELGDNEFLVSLVEKLINREY